MKNKVKGFLVGVFVTMVFINSLAYATGNTELIEVIFNSVNVALNGNEVANVGESYTLSNGQEIPFSMVYKGTTYLPIRKVATMLGQEVTWDGETHTVGLGESIKIVEEEVVNKEIKIENDENKEPVIKKDIYKIIINGEDAGLNKEIYDNGEVLYISVREAADIIGCKCDFNSEKNEVALEKLDNHISIVINDHKYKLNEDIKTKDHSIAIIHNNRMMIDINVLLDLNVQVSVDESKKTIGITYKVIQENVEDEVKVEELELNKSYKLESGLELVINNIKINEELGYNNFTINYKLLNNTKDKELDEGHFIVEFDTKEKAEQGGFFGTLFPYEKKEREVNFKYLKGRQPILIEFKEFGSNGIIKLRVQ
ncbi:hypothetical protein AN1V17_42070 [Vallitalea sediminicola]